MKTINILSIFIIIFLILQMNCSRLNVLPENVWNDLNDNINATPAPTPLRAWQTVGTSITSAGSFISISLAVDYVTGNYVPFIATQESGIVFVRRFNGSGWNFLKSAAGVNDYVSTSCIGNVHLVIAGGVPYLGYIFSSGPKLGFVAKNNSGTQSWELYGNATEVTNGSESISINIDGTTAYAGVHHSATLPGLYVKSSSSTINPWTDVFKNDSIPVSFVHIIRYNGMIYAAYLDTAQWDIYVRNSPTNIIAGGGASENGVMMDFSFVNDGGTLYVAFIDETAAQDKLTVRKCNVSSGGWSNVGPARFSDGMVMNVSLAISNGVPYVAFTDNSISNRLSVARYNSSSNTWEYLGGKGITTYATSAVSLIVLNGEPFVAYVENAAPDKLYVKRFAVVP